jgi:hypothetical protein
MPRVEKGQSAKSEIEELTSEVIREVRQIRKPRVRTLVSIASLGVLLIVCSWLLWLVASTGFVTVPGFTRFAYKELSPTREVTSGVPIQTHLSSELGTMITERLQAGGGTLSDASVSVSIPESAFTASLREGLRTDNNSLFDIERAQVAVIGDTGLEIFLPVAQSKLATAFKITIGLSSVDGNLKLEIPDAWLGGLHVPNWLTLTMLEPPLQHAVSLFQSELNRYASLREVTTRDGELIIAGDLTVEVLHFQQ